MNIFIDDNGILLLYIEYCYPQYLNYKADGEPIHINQKIFDNAWFGNLEGSMLFALINGAIRICRVTQDY